MRAFIGIPIDNEAAKIIYQHTAHYQKLCGELFLRLSQTSNYHITLSFLGNINSIQLMRLEDQFNQLSQHNLLGFNLKLISICPFPMTFPKVIAVMLQPNEALNQLRQSVVSMVNVAGIFQKKTKFIPHLTVARVNVVKGISKPYYPLLELHEEIYINQINLYESQLLKSGAKYMPRLYFRW
ncbi:RNA 2',3'-cyclic phosphodiesterase [Thiotrichales bacterium 19S3-7]|nr:RNA 2',3'-cyclic phosphodiesterase [Thiotrichales bacterium 19S3-7]MCF6802825.1 RNA 2',3'-cyclic phosphodiesterase [Thiotrichales bacterium 19S3-11]